MGFKVLHSGRTGARPPAAAPAPATDPEADPSNPRRRRSDGRERAHTSGRGDGMPHFPALEGLRGLAVVAVVLFHAHLPGRDDGYFFPGGFLGVSTFFTLSGFLITALLLSERLASGTIDLRQFWLRRFRRLMPASLVALGVVAAFGLFAADEVQKRNLGGDVVASLAYVANWRFLAADGSYADIFGQASPVAHFWSLAIEEQFYVVFPLLAWFLLARRRLRRGMFALVLGGLAAASLAFGLFVPMSPDDWYYNTGTRAIELVIGALLAVAVFDRRVTHRLANDRRVQRGVVVAGGLAVAGSAAMWALVDESGDRSPWLYKGGFAGYSLLTAAVIAAAITPAGPLRVVLSIRPLRWLGKISYGVYLFHWPVFLWLDHGRTGLEWAPLFAVRIAATAAVALLSFHLVETPIRVQRLRSPFPIWRLAPPLVATLGAVAVFVTVTAPAPPIDYSGAQLQLAAATKDAGPPPEPVDTRAKEPDRPRIATFGDSTALMTGLGLADWAVTTKRAQPTDGVARLGCGITRGGEQRDEKGGVGKVRDECNRWETYFQQAIDNEEPHIALVQIGPWEVADRRFDGEKQWRTLGDPSYDAFVLDEMTKAIDILSSHGAIVEWLTSPVLGGGSTGKFAQQRGNAAKPERMHRLNELIRQLPTLRPGKVEILDLATWLDSTNEDARLRPDGVHFSAETSSEVARRFLGDAVLQAFHQAWTERADEMRAAAENPAELAGDDRFLTKRYKVLVVGDASAQVVADSMKVWADKGALEVTPVVNPACGLLTVATRDERGTQTKPPRECDTAVFGVLQKAAALKPDYVLVVPSAWDLADARLRADGPVVSWSDTTRRTDAEAQFTKMVTALNKAGITVEWANPVVGDPTKGGLAAAAAVLPATDTARAEAYAETVKQVLVGLPRVKNEPPGLLEIDLAKWAAKNLPALADGAPLDDKARTALGTWIAKESYLKHDGNGVLSTRRS